MPEITAKLVNELRARRPSQAMMDCKKMLTEQVDGDIEKAIEEFPQEG